LSKHSHFLASNGVPHSGRTVFRGSRDSLPVEVDTAAGLPKIVLIGLSEMAVRESVHRIERALANLGYQRHTDRTVMLRHSSCRSS
jgi:hypothetical protein